MDVWRCPQCSSRAVGKVGHEHYYCSDCCIEFAKRKNELLLYEVADDGTLVSLVSEELST